MRGPERRLVRVLRVIALADLGLSRFGHIKLMDWSVELDVARTLKSITLFFKFPT